MSGNPYFDRFDPTTNRTMVLFVPGVHAQNSEINEVESILSYYLGELGNIIADDGDMQTGMNYTKSGNNITVASGKLYLAGKVRSFSEQTVTIAGTGLETVGVRLHQQVVTYKDDSSLNDPTVGYEGSGTNGADRLVETVELVANDSAAATIYQFSDGALFKGHSGNMLSKVEDIMARRDYETLGSYKIDNGNGQPSFALSLGTSPDDPANKVRLTISSGVAYVQGYRIEKPSASYLDLDKATDTEQILNEQQQYNTGTDVYSLAFTDVKDITNVTAQVQQTFAITHKATDGTDYVVDNLISIDRVYTEGSSGVTYQSGTDYVMTGNSISWSPSSGNEPAVNQSYMVTATFNKTLSGNGVDYTSTIGTGVGSTSSISFAGATGSGSTAPYVPKDGGFITITYDIYQYRTDLITLDVNGNFTVHRGQPARQDVVAPPTVVDSLTLTIGTATVFPNSDTGVCQDKAIVNQNFERQAKALARLANVEYNQIQNSLDIQAMQMHNPTDLRGVLTDNFTTMYKYDESYDNTGTNTLNKFKANVMFDFDDGTITLPRTAMDADSPNLNLDSSTVHTYGHLVTAPFTPFPIVSQLLVTEFRNINDDNLTERQAQLILTPSADNWVDVNNITVTQTKTTSYNTRRFWLHGGVSANDANAYYDANTEWDAASKAYIDAGWSRWQNSIQGTILESGGQQVTDSQIQYMRPQTITFESVGLIPNTDNLTLTFAGTVVPITPLAGFNAGSNAGTVASDATGTAKGTFVIPANVPCGTVEVRLQNNNNVGIASYSAEGINRTVEDIIYQTHVTAYLTDPLAQTFQAPMDTHCPKIDLFFGSKDATAPVRVEIRSVSLGQPTNLVLGDTILYPDDITVDPNGSKPTTVAFDRPINLVSGNSYAIVIVSDSDNYTLGVAKQDQQVLGGTDVLKGQAYVAGVLFHSSNADYWTGEQDEDLAFTIYGTQFTDGTPATMLFDPMTGLKIDQFVLLASFLTPDNTGCTWEYRMILDGQNTTIDSLPWKPLISQNLTNIQGTATTVQLRATFIPNQYISPIMSLDDLTFGAFITALSGDYVTLNVDASDSPFNHISLEYEENLPGNSSVIPQYSTDGGVNWNNFVSTPTSTVVGTGWNDIKYEETLSAQAKQIKFHLALKTPNPYQRPTVRKFMSSWIDQ